MLCPFLCWTNTVGEICTPACQVHTCLSQLQLGSTCWWPGVVCLLCVYTGQLWHSSWGWGAQLTFLEQLFPDPKGTLLPLAQIPNPRVYPAVFIVQGHCRLHSQITQNTQDSAPCPPSLLTAPKSITHQSCLKRLGCGSMTEYWVLPQHNTNQVFGKPEAGGSGNHCRFD